MTYLEHQSRRAALLEIIEEHRRLGRYRARAVLNDFKTRHFDLYELFNEQMADVGWTHEIRAIATERKPAASQLKFKLPPAIERLWTTGDIYCPDDDGGEGDFIPPDQVTYRRHAAGAEYLLSNAIVSLRYAEEQMAIHQFVAPFADGREDDLLVDILRDASEAWDKHQTALDFENAGELAGVTR